MFTINYSLFKFNYNWQHCSAISLTSVMLCVCNRRVCVKFTVLVCKAVRLAFSCQTSAISFPFILFPGHSTLSMESQLHHLQKVRIRRKKVCIWPTYLCAQRDPYGSTINYILTRSAFCNSSVCQINKIVYIQPTAVVGSRYRRTEMP